MVYVCTCIHVYEFYERCVVGKTICDLRKKKIKRVVETSIYNGGFSFVLVTPIHSTGSNVCLGYKCKSIRSEVLEYKKHTKNFRPNILRMSEIKRRKY